MAIRFDASTEGLQRTTNLPSITAFTMMGWFRMVTDRNAYSTLLAHGQSTASTPFYSFQTNTDGTTLLLWNSNSTSANGSSMVVGTWVHLAMTCEGTGAGQLKAYVNGALDITHDGNAGPTAAKMWFGSSPDTNWFNGRVAALKVWDVALTADEIAAEVHTIRPQKPDSINSWFPCFAGSAERLRDYSGAARNVVSTGGTLSDEDPPPVSWGASVIWIPRPAGSSGSTYDSATTLAKTIATSSSTLLTMDAATTLVASRAISDGALGDLGALNTIAKSLTLSDSAIGDLLSALSIARSPAIAEIGNLDILANSTIAKVTALTAIGSASFDSVLSIAKAIATSPTGLLSIDALSTIAKTTSLTNSSLLDAQAVTTIAKAVALLESGLLDSQAVTAIAKTIAILTDGTVTAGSNTYESTLSIAKTLAASFASQQDLVTLLSIAKVVAILEDVSIGRSLDVSLGSANRELATTSLIGLTQSTSFPRNSGLSMGVLNRVLPGISFNTIGAISLSESIDSGGGSNPQVNASVNKVTGCGMAIAIRIGGNGSIDTTKQMGMDVTVTIPLSMTFNGERTLAEKPVPPQVPFVLGPFGKENYDGQSPEELLRDRGIPPTGSR